MKLRLTTTIKTRPGEAGLRIHDEQIKSAYRKNSLIEFIIETSAVMGVKVGIA